MQRLPFSIRVLLESALRNLDDYIVSQDDVKALAGWFVEEHDDHPSETWLKDFVEEEVGHLLKDEN